MRTQLSRLTIASSVVLFCTERLDAQDVPDLVTDRPDQTESAVTLGPGSFQIEFGVGAEFDNADQAGDVSYDDVSVPSALLRIGTIAGIELRAGTDFTLSSRSTTDDCDEEPCPDSSVSAEVVGLNLGTKIEILDGNGLSPAIAVLGTVSSAYDSQPSDWSPVSVEGRLSLSHELSELHGLGYNLGVNWTEGDDVRTFYTLAYGVGVTGSLGLFVELYGNGPGTDGSDHSVDAGGTFLLVHNLQLDLFGGVGLTEQAPDYMVGAGLSMRFPE